MASNNNIFYATNPARMLDALYDLLRGENIDLSRALIFLPSRRAVRSVEKMLVEKIGHAVMLPHLVPLGEGMDDAEFSDDTDIISDTHRLVALTRLLAADAGVGNIAAALPVARDLLRMTDYLENEGVDAATIDWTELVDEKYAAHFQNKARLLTILSNALRAYAGDRMTGTARRNADIRAWIDYFNSSAFDMSLVVVCGSTGSVPATADLMAAVAQMPNGRIILSGKIDGRDADFALNTNPYNSEYKFLSRLGVSVGDVRAIDVGPSAIDFMNHAFGNNPAPAPDMDAVRHCHLIECSRESEEAAAVAEITARAMRDDKTVLVITPDAAANQRIATAFAVRGIVADFSGAVSAAMSTAGRAILNKFDDWLDAGRDDFDKLYAAANFDLFEMLLRMVDNGVDAWNPAFDRTDAQYFPMWAALRELSDALTDVGVQLTLNDARAFVADTLSGVGIRAPMNTDARVAVIGTIESRMQTADVIIMTGLNDGMFPARGYENAWLPRVTAEKIGLPSADRKVSLMSLDFMNLSCGADVYWLRSRASGGTQTTESRFLSRVVARGGAFDRHMADEILRAVRGSDDVPARPLDTSAPTPPADWSDVYVTELELLVHNPYAFYVRHILRLRVLDDYWVGPDARKFGTLVHDVIEHAAPGVSPDVLVGRMDAAAMELLGPDSVMFHFWHRRFVEIAPVIANELSATINAATEIGGHVQIAGRTVRARADRIWDGGVLDIKTGAAPSKKQLIDGNMPQLPLEAYILQQGGFPFRTTDRSQTPVMTFLQLKNNDARPITYDAATTAQMMRAAIDKATELFNMYSAGAAPYEYRETSDAKYRAYDDLARVAD